MSKLTTKKSKDKSFKNSNIKKNKNKKRQSQSVDAEGQLAKWRKLEQILEKKKNRVVNLNPNDQAKKIKAALNKKSKKKDNNINKNLNLLETDTIADIDIHTKPRKEKIEYISSKTRAKALLEQIKTK